MNDKLNNISLNKLLKHKNLVLNICTAIGAFGGMPDPPKFFTFFVDNIPGFKWLMTIILIYQGGGEQDILLAMQIALGFFVLKYSTDLIWDFFYNDNNNNNKTPIYY
jgi:hypothetical protein